MRAARVDANQAEVVAALRAAGCLVQPLHRVGGGVPDLLVARGNRLHLIEIKDGRKSPSARELTPEQERWHAEWDGYVYVVCDVPQALRAVGISPCPHCNVAAQVGHSHIYTNGCKGCEARMLAAMP